MRTTMHPLAEAYLARLGSAAQALPPTDRDDLLAEIRGHLQAGLLSAPSDAEVRNLLQELGEPEAIVAAALSESGPPGPLPYASSPPAAPAPAAPPAASPWGTVEILAVLGLTVGMFVLPVVGPLVGIVLVWVSARWTLGEKWVATALTLLPVATLVLGAGMFLVSGSSTGDVQVPTPVVSEAGLP